MKKPKAKAAGSEVKEKGVAEVMMEKLEVLKGMTAKQLVEHAKKEFKAEFNIGNGRPWLYKKVAYLEQERVNGNKGNAAVRAAKLDEPEEIEKAKKQAEKETVKTEEKSKRDKALMAKIKNGAERDEAGFITGTNRSMVFKALQAGCKTEEIKKIPQGMAIYNWLQKTEGRSVVVEVKDGFAKIKSFEKVS